ncbi:hypothetical protein M409DRAFT_27720 [Zasmidium cellare ATCC 36951]|uniref:Uncharacterized protein n=1 Tax=Zasmidium cellare ATCC 36951 TaxID=1080233 RepID=A0A6A6C4Q4_ZASCE|nr:uncharacterized protein M409DRAFT_27720 [Zasmidium cellare ATCC 36951]KAF2161995.1 hypothetical protein M409DRAFT_27720 [Zasmidium cellare ATCC 36951]
MDPREYRAFDIEDDIASEKTRVHGEMAARSTDSIATPSSNPASKPTPPPDTPSAQIYRNSLLLAVGYLDLTNALDFPANVWNNVPIPTYAMVLMGLGGSIALLAIGIAVWDMLRCWRNIAFLRRERAGLIQQPLNSLQQAWLAINTRELCWETIDRFLLDFFMGVTGLFVGVGTLLAMKGDDHEIFLVSNILSGYLGNSFLALYAVVNSIWSGIMWRRAHKNQAAVRRSNLDVGLAKLMKLHAWKHQMYALVNGTTLVVSGVASLVSATMWQGYVVQIPCVIASLFVVHYWRFCLGYDRLSFQQRLGAGEMAVEARLRAVIGVRTALERKYDDDGVVDFVEVIGDCGEVGRDAILEFLHDLGMDQAILARMSAQREVETSVQEFSEAVNSRVRAAGLRRLKYEERFLLELYGYYLRVREAAPACSKG